jgi:hypothetical protein
METESENPELPPKKKKTSPKKTIKPKSLASEQIQKMLKEVILKSVDEKLRSNHNEIDALVSTMEEFLRCFIVVGYNLNNEPLIITNARSQIDADALQTALSRLFFSIQNGGPHGGH